MYIAGMGWFLFLFSLAQAAPLEHYRDVKVPDAYAFSGWIDAGHATTAVDAFALPHAEIKCRDKTLYPTHPQQDSKLYHEYKIGDYQAGRLDGKAEACLVSTSAPNRQGRYFCLRADRMHTALLSDIFSDSCGNLYRGIWRVSFLKQYDNMGILASLGRTLYLDTKSSLHKMYIAGNTYAISREHLMLLTSALPGDKEYIARLRSQAQRTHLYHVDSRLFSLRD